jgi:hypothetical protein
MSWHHRVTGPSWIGGIGCTGEADSGAVDDDRPAVGDATSGMACEVDSDNVGADDNNRRGDPVRIHSTCRDGDAVPGTDEDAVGDVVPAEDAVGVTGSSTTGTAARGEAEPGGADMMQP